VSLVNTGRPVTVPGMVLTDHELQVPLDHSRPGGPTITVFGREIASPTGRDLPFLVYFQGGPGHEAARPTRHPWSPGWLERALVEFRVLMLDQRGTGRSTPVADLSGLTAEQQADYLTNFRADSIVRDAELFRQALRVDAWSVLGQSFGGFCVLTYLSLAPLGLREAIFTGGLPPLRRPADDVYLATYERMRERNRKYYEVYPQDRPRVLQLCQHLRSQELNLPSGDRLTPRRLRQLGIMLGMSDGRERLHYILERDPDSLGFRHDVEAELSFARNPLYAAIHEACYADGTVTGWAAQRTLPADFVEHEELFTGEHVFPWMFDEYSALAPLGRAAQILSQFCWPRLYDESALQSNSVPCAAAIFTEDAYVERAFSEETAATVRGLRPWITNEYQHNALACDGARVLDRLLGLARGLE